MKKNIAIDKIVHDNILRKICYEVNMKYGAYVEMIITDRDVQNLIQKKLMEKNDD